jgi:hypothetical protein
MKGDFSRLTFDPTKQYTRVLMQQGRVQVDADWNEQTAILLHYLQTLAVDLIGPFGGPEGALGFEIKFVPASGGDAANLEIGKGRYYVDGLLCENLADGVRYFGQPGFPRDPKQDPLPAAPFLAYLDVWERHVTYLVDDHLREVALGGPDTATRAQVVWQVRVMAPPQDSRDFPQNAKDVDKRWPDWVEAWQPKERGRLKARAKADGDPTNPCLASPEASYRGAENQLYRVEIQDGERKDGKTTWLSFKWSRENGSVVFPVRELQGLVASLESLGRDAGCGLKRGDWVEIVDDDTEVGARSWSLLQVEEIKGLEVTLKAAADDASPTLPVYVEGDVPKKHVLLRRWDHRASTPPKNGPKPRGAVLYVFLNDPDPKVEETWLTLEDGVQIQFQPGLHRAGDYWLIPARTATGDVEWPGTPQAPEAVAPHGVEHHFAPLALVKATGLNDLRKKIPAQAVPV